MLLSVVIEIEIRHLKYIFIAMSIYSYCMFMYLHRANWHSSAILTEVLPCFFLSCKANSRVKSTKMGHGPQSFKFLCCSMYLFVFFRSLYFCVCKCVLYYCHRVATQLQLTNIHYQYCQGHTKYGNTEYPRLYSELIPNVRYW